MLLTVLMVVGILPLSLFASEEALSSETGGSLSATYEERSLAEIQEEFAKHGMDLKRYQSFENLSTEILKTLCNSEGQAILGTDYDFSTNPTSTRYQHQYNDYDDESFGSFLIANQTPAFEVITESDGNKALYLGNADASVGQNYLNFNEELLAADRAKDFFVSMDIKLEGDKVFVPHAIYTFIYRAAGPHEINTLLVNEDGELYMGEYAKENIVGRLKKDTYTRIALATDRANNKYYIYINDVLANPGGTTLFDETAVNTYNTESGRTYNAETIQLDCIRAFITSNNVVSGGKDGVFFDNLVQGSRYAVVDRDTADKNILVSNFAGATAGAVVYPATSSGKGVDTPYYGTSAESAAFGGTIGGHVFSDSLKYVDEDGDTVVDAIQYGADHEAIAKMGFTTDWSNVQAFIEVGVNSSQNVSVSFKLKMGADGVGGSSGLMWHDICQGVRYQRDFMRLDANGNIKVDGVVVGTINKDTYTTVRADIVMNGAGAALYFIYIGNELKYVKLEHDYNNEEYMHIRTFRLYTQFNNAANTGDFTHLNKNDLLMKDIVVKHISDYNDLYVGTYPFAKVLSGFSDMFGGITRYYDGKGGYATEDFVLGTTKYIVGDNGEIISKISGSLPQRTLNEIKEAFAAQGVGLRFYQSFNNWAMDEGKTTYNFLSENTVAAAGGYTVPQLSDYEDIDEDGDGDVDITAKSQYDAAVATLNSNLKTAGLLSMSSGTPLYQAYQKQSINLNAEFSYDTANNNGLKNFRDALSVVTEENGNKALLYSYAPNTVVYSSDASGSDGIADALANHDNFVDLVHGLSDSYSKQRGNGAFDLFVSGDFKMNGVNVNPSSLYSLVYRPNNGGANELSLVRLSEVGGIYVSNSYNPDKLVGFLSENEYTRIAVATDRANNKFYVYLNDVLVTPNGEELFPQTIVDTMNSNNATGNGITYTAQNLPVCEVRMYTCGKGNHEHSSSHKGLYMDNLLLGVRAAVKSTTTVAGTPFSYVVEELNKPVNNPDGVLGQPGGIIDKTPFGTSASIGTDPETRTDGTVRYVDEDGDGIADAIEWHKVEGAIDTADATKEGQSFLGVNNPSGGVKGSNLRFEMDLKGGQDGQLGTQAATGDNFFLMFRSQKGTNGSSAHAYEIYVNLAADGRLLVNTYIDSSGALNGNKMVIGQITPDKYTNLRIDFICNAIDGSSPYAAFYVDGCLMYVLRFTIGYATGTYSATDYHPSFVRIYSNYAAQTKNLKDRDIRVKTIKYATTQDFDAPRARMSMFENKIAGLYGIAGITRYYNGDSTFKTEDFYADGEKYTVGIGGAIVGPESLGRELAPYAPYVDWDHTGTLLQDSPNGSAITTDSSPIRIGRDAYTRSVTLPNSVPATLYTSFYDAEVGIENDHSSYCNMNFSDGLKNTSVTIDLDIMLSQAFSEDKDSEQAFIYLRGQETSSNGGGRRDYDFPIFMTGDGWLTYSGRKIAKLSQTEFTRLSVVVHGPEIDSSDALATNSSIDIYLNGVMILEGLQNGQSPKYLQQIRFLKMCDVDFSAYFKDVYMYSGDKPQQFYTMVDGEAVLTADQEKTPAKASDIKQGLVYENGVTRYYDELGLPIISGSITVGDKTYTANDYGKVFCDGKNHIQVTDKGFCIGCGKMVDGASALYGTSLVLGSDVKIVFYLDLDTANATGVEVGLDIDYTNGTTVVTPIEELGTVTQDGKTYYKVIYAVSGKDIYSNITARVVKADGSTGTEFSYSAAQYAEDVQTMPTDEKYTEEVKALASALLVYGKNAAAVLAGGEAAETIENVSFDGISGASGDADAFGIIKLKKFSLELKSNIKIKVYFSFDADAALMYGITSIENYTVTAGGNKVTPTPVSDPDLGDMYCIEYEVKAAKLGDEVTFSIDSGLGSVMNLRLSAVQYAKIVNGSASASDAEKNLMKAIKLYADAAVAYAEGVAEDNRPAV